VDDPIVPPPPTINILLLESTIPNPSIQDVWTKKWVINQQLGFWRYSQMRLGGSAVA